MNKEAYEIPPATAPIEPKVQEDRSEQTEGVMPSLDVNTVFRNFRFLLFLTGLAILHIANNHYAENTIRRINKMERSLKELRWSYMTIKSEMMFRSKQSEVARMVEPLGLKELQSPPFKITVTPASYE